MVFFWICFIYVFKIEDWPSIDEHQTPLFSSPSLLTDGTTTVQNE
jgi:hypothetical protein